MSRILDIPAQPFLALRGRLMTPPRREVDLVRRGFAAPRPEARANLERAGHGFLDGFSLAASTRTTDRLVHGLEAIDPLRRGFAYEGAGMALAMLDAVPGARGHHMRRLLEHEGARHVYMVYVGAGWALARLPKARWEAATRGLEDPVLTWLALDGYGFHQTYFRTEEYLAEGRVEDHFPWPAWDETGYSRHAIDQGVGRALWFVEGAYPRRVAHRVETFAPDRRGDLYSGVGLAATYAGGANDEQLAELGRRAGPLRPSLFQGSVFAAEARRRAGNVTPDTERAVRALTGLSVVEASDIALGTRPDTRYVGGDASFDVWRDRIMSHCGELSESA
ncbi:DUF1702 family protein [Phycicoccus sp. CSK15P-2]|uniref:DUF1702 family protein n=1 Tax=Phycicoccus sp. CSK15P-2 TaxID=2807627 RepID=UPI001951D31B|nr:DUF1702 family protein [Phycicoccus sp. CSK15P-2]MBM6405597.1 DUF1702 family protein [Phycicoccus sp. CSK15P-2]